MAINGVGNPHADIVIVGEMPRHYEVKANRPFAGNAGTDLTAMLYEAGLVTADCYFTLVMKAPTPIALIDSLFYDKAKTRPKEELIRAVIDLHAEIKAINPKVVVACGDLALYALCGKLSVDAWRGSYLTVNDTDIPCIPTYSPITIQRQWEYRVFAVRDLTRVKGILDNPQSAIEPPKNFLLAPSFPEVEAYLSGMLATLDNATDTVPIVVDIETRRRSFIDCIGLATSKTSAICIPFDTHSNPHYFTEDEEFQVVRLLSRIFRHPKAGIITQNGLYDEQYTITLWGAPFNNLGDTMIMHALCYPGLPKSLDFLSSLYCSWHRFWKNESQEADTSLDDRGRWVYNCKDTTATFEIWEVLQGVIKKRKLTAQFEFLMTLRNNLLRMMLRGVKINTSRRAEVSLELMTAASQYEAFIHRIVGKALNPKSPKQMREFFYDELHLPPVFDRKKGTITCSFEALTKLSKREPLIWPVVSAFIDLRSIGTYHSNFIKPELDSDGRVRCTFNPVGAETFRLSSSENAFGRGMNFQNLPKGGQKKTRIAMPNIRAQMVPDSNHTFYDIDLDRADLQVVVWEADDRELKQMLREGVDLHIENAKVLYNKTNLNEDSPERQVAKQFVHGTNYGGKAKTMAAVCGLTVHETERMQARWFGAHPGILEWHQRTEHNLETTRSVTNAFGFVRTYYDRIDAILPEALAWIPQSTVAIVINTGLNNAFADKLLSRYHEILIQVHDSVAGQYVTAQEAFVLPRLHQHFLVTIPYSDPLIIPVGLKTSTESWGVCKGKAWPK